MQVGHFDDVDPFTMSGMLCMSNSCMIMASDDLSYFIFMLNLMLIQLEYNVDRVMVPLNRVFPSATTFAFMGRPLFGLLSCLWSVPLTREGYGHALPWPGKQT